VRSAGCVVRRAGTQNAACRGEAESEDGRDAEVGINLGKGTVSIKMTKPLTQSFAERPIPAAPQSTAEETFKLGGNNGFY